MWQGVVLYLTHVTQATSISHPRPASLLEGFVISYPTGSPQGQVGGGRIISSTLGGGRRLPLRPVLALSSLMCPLLG